MPVTRSVALYILKDPARLPYGSDLRQSDVRICPTLNFFPTERTLNFVAYVVLIDCVHENEKPLLFPAWHGMEICATGEEAICAHLRDVHHGQHNRGDESFILRVVCHRASKEGRRDTGSRVDLCSGISRFAVARMDYARSRPGYGTTACIQHKQELPGRSLREYPAPAGPVAPEKSQRRHHQQIEEGTRSIEGFFFHTDLFTSIHLANSYSPSVR